MTSDQEKDDYGVFPESWSCVDCGVNTAPGMVTRAEAKRVIEAAKAEGKEWGTPITIDDQSEVYTVRDKVWKAAGMEGFGGCLCIGCLESVLAASSSQKIFNVAMRSTFPIFQGRPD